MLDLGLPGIDGIEVIRGLRGWSTRADHRAVGARRRADKVAALDAGADDYVTKPFGMDELLARLRAALRRARPAEEEAAVVDRRLRHRPRGQAACTRDGERGAAHPHRVAPGRGARAQPGKLVTQRQLLQEVWGPAYERETNYLRVYMAQVRRKLEPEPVRPRLLRHRAGHGLPLRAT